MTKRVDAPDLFTAPTLAPSEPALIVAPRDELEEVLAALERADEPDRRLDVRLSAHVLPPVSAIAIRGQFDTPCYTGEETWAIGLLTEILPDWWWTVGKCKLNAHASCGPDRDGADAALLADKRFDEGFHAECAHGVPALALCIVALKGLIARTRAVRS